MQRAPADPSALRLRGAANPLAPAAAALRRPAPRRACRSAGAASVRAMVNVDVSPSVVLGVGLIGAGVSLWQIRRCGVLKAVPVAANVCQRRAFARCPQAAALLVVCTCLRTAGDVCQGRTLHASPPALSGTLGFAVCAPRMPSPARASPPPARAPSVKQPQLGRFPGGPAAPKQRRSSYTPSLLRSLLRAPPPRRVKPWLSKDYDVVVSCISLLVGGILIFQVGPASRRAGRIIRLLFWRRSAPL